MKKTLKLVMLYLVLLILLTSCKIDLGSNGTLENVGNENVNPNKQSTNSTNNSPYRPPNRDIQDEG